MMQNGLLTSPFTKSIRLQLDEREPGFYSVKSVTATDLIQPVNSWAHLLFFQYEPNFFGLSANKEDDAIYLSASELLDLLSPKFSHPFVQFEGSNEESDQLIRAVRSSSTSFGTVPRFGIMLYSPRRV